MATVFASSTLAGAFAAACIYVFVLGHVDPKFGAIGSFGIYGAIAGVSALAGAFGCYLAKRGFEHSMRQVALWGVCGGAGLQLLLISPLSGTDIWLALPVLLVGVVGFAAARLSELDSAVGSGRHSSPNTSLERTRER